MCCVWPPTASNSRTVKDFGFGGARRFKHQAAVGAVYLNDAFRRAGGVAGQDRFHRLDGGDDLPIGGEIVVGEIAHRRETIHALVHWPAELDESRLVHESLNDLDAVAALAPLAPRL